MYKLIIADDEKKARDAVIRYIENSNLGFEVTGAFSDGEETLKFLEQNHVDVVITDIKMPKMSGLELAKKLYGAMPHIKVIIISGYSEFEYAKKAIEYNVLNYIVKPIDIGELAETLKTLGKRLEEAQDIKINLEETDSILKEQFFADLTIGALKEEEIGRCFKSLDFPFNIEESAGAFLNIKVVRLEEFLNKRWKYGKEKLGMAILNLLKKHFNTDSVYHILQKYDSFSFVLINKKASDVKKEMTVLGNNIKNILTLDIELVNVYDFDNISELSGNTLITGNEKIKLLISHIKSGNGEGARNIFCNMVKDEIKIEDLILKINVALLNSNSGNSKLRLIKLPDINSTEFIEKILNDIVYCFKDESPENEIIKKAKIFMEENCGIDISRDDVADHVYLNSAYFSRYFKQHTGENFYDYLISIRMKKAVELLFNNVKIYKIVELVGYKSRKHFLKVFKKYTGYVPNEYKKYVLKIESTEEEWNE